MAYVRKSFAVSGDVSQCAAMLQGYGAWDESELADHDANLDRSGVADWLCAGGGGRSILLRLLRGTMDEKPEKLLVTAEETSHLLSVSIKTLDAWRSKGLRDRHSSG